MRGGEEGREGGGQEVGELAEGAGGPGVDLEVRGERGGAWVGGEGEVVESTFGFSSWSGDGVEWEMEGLAWGKGGKNVPVEATGAVEEFEVEGAGCLAVDLAVGAGLHGHGY